MRSNAGLILVALRALLLCSAAAPSTLYVFEGNNGTPPYDTQETAAGTIQEAVDAAEYRDVVRVAPGLYVEQVTLRDGVVLWGSGSDKTVLKQPEDAPYGNVITGAADAEIRELHIVSPEYHEFQWWRGTGVYLGPWPGQLVSDCRITGPFIYGVECDGPPAEAPTVIRRCTIQGAWDGIDVGGEWASYVVQDCALRNNKGFGVSAGSIEFGTITIIRSIVSGSTSGIYIIGGWQVSVENCTVENNSAHGIYAQQFADVTVWSTVVSGSRTGVGYDEETTGEVVNCTVVDNRHGLLYGSTLHVRVANTIIWGAEYPLTPKPDPEIPATPAVTFSDIQGGYEGEGNIDSDPLFMDPSAGDFRLRAGSLCVDAGLADPYRPGWWYGVDRSGHRRKVYGGKAYEVDMGAYEFYINDLSPGPEPGQTTYTWSSLADKTYSIFYTEDLLTWHLVLDTFPSAGNGTTSWTDDGSLTGLPPSLAPRRFYRLLENP